MATATVTRAQSTSSVPAIPRPSASALIVNERNEILFVQRNPKANSFGGTYVFPGGNFDPKQDDSLALTAIRETFEETGLLLASSDRSGEPDLDDAVLNEARNAIHSNHMSFSHFLTECRLEPDIQSLFPFTSWVTPVQVPRRFHAQFFITFLPHASSSGFSEGSKHSRLPTPDGGQEVVAASFLHPATALFAYTSGRIALMPPQFYLLSTLAEILQGERNTREQRERVYQLSRGSFGRMVINPRALGTDAEGRTVLTYEGDETRGGAKGRLHRSLVRFGKGGVPTENMLLRNFDIFSEIEPHAFTPHAKL
ncbi:hypothetical protein GLOTRDRAFT_136739 [Gloeophyllum trabeum ATCC 11539]|uniref:Nudix hydrolase domain-containing protein n=1 Tax=Gloeophyllum trabeum (strain ATCC 11539 / FP-39264 / Madison 617) TaxID=670483 RepID=S7QDK1_GLOTA|nr:uncharacterized protein GLOTRDRAFT_136739 [Gloeophyllum trabeum ATCC 11539]EPQ57906.1 hypothetical protein GLOTRDRAFT_136739 [Gloeophyllum trabeum ATCC 11539]